MKRLALFLLYAGVCFGQINNGGGGSSTPTTPGGPIGGLSQISGLTAEYRLTEGSGTTITDSSGNGNTGTFTAGHFPTWIATGGLAFAGGTQSVDLPAGLNSSKTIIIALNQPNIITQGNLQESPLVSSTNSSNCTGFMLDTASVPNANYQQYATRSNGSIKSSAIGPVVGVHVLTLIIPGTTADVFYLDGVSIGANGTTPLQTAGHYVLGSNAGGCDPGTGFAGSIYYLAFFSTALTQTQMFQANSLIANILNNQGTPVANNGPSADTLLLSGDSEMSNLAIPATTIFMPAGVNIWNFGVSGQTSGLLLTEQPYNDLALVPTTGRFVDIIWSGTNDNAGTEANTLLNQERFCANVHAKNGQCIVGTMLSRTAKDTQKNTMNGLFNLYWKSFAEGEINFGINPNLGADGASANTTFFTDGVHTTTASRDNILDRMIHTFANRILFGKNNFDQATLYTTGAPAATAITATSESTNTVTVTTTLNPPAGSCAIIAGVTPAGYNNQANVPCYFVLTTAAGNFTYFNFNSGLGAGTVFGTASVPLQKEVDNFVRLGGSGTSQVFTLLTCQEWSNGDGPTIRNENTTSPWVLTPINSETINGQATFTMPTATTGHFQTVKLSSQQVSTSAGGCNWTTSQP